MAITNLTKMCYTLLNNIICEYRLNEMYTSQWMGLFLHHVLRANDDNAVGADNFVSALCDENKIILTEMITEEVIQNFIDECDKGKEEPRLLQLLTALCGTADMQVERTQNAIVSILTQQEEAKNKLIMPIRRVKKRHEIEVCLDYATQHWEPLYVLSQTYEKIMKKIRTNENFVPSAEEEDLLIEYECFCGSLDLFAETCLGRNERNQKILQNWIQMPEHLRALVKPKEGKEEKIMKGVYEGKLLLVIFQDERMTDKIRSKSLKLYLEACLDIRPFKRLQVPSGQAVLEDLNRLELTGNDLIEAVQCKDPKYKYQIKATQVRIPPRINELKVVME